MLAAGDVSQRLREIAHSFTWQGPAFTRTGRGSVNIQPNDFYELEKEVFEDLVIDNAEQKFLEDTYTRLPNNVSYCLRRALEIMKSARNVTDYIVKTSNNRSERCSVSPFCFCEGAMTLLGNKVEAAIQYDPVVVDALSVYGVTEENFKRSKLLHEINIPAGRSAPDTEDTDVVEVSLSYENSDRSGYLSATVYFRLDEDGNLSLMDKGEVKDLRWNVSEDEDVDLGKSIH